MQPSSQNIGKIMLYKFTAIIEKDVIEQEKKEENLKKILFDF